MDSGSLAKHPLSVLNVLSRSSFSVSRMPFLPSAFLVPGVEGALAFWLGINLLMAPELRCILLYGLPPLLLFKLLAPDKALSLLGCPGLDALNLTPSACAGAVA